MAWGDGPPKPWQQLQIIIGAATCTDSGYQGHLKNGTPPCQPCRDARAETGRRQRAARRAA